jgi:hypothetical protein
MLAVCEDVPMYFDRDKQTALALYIAQRAREDAGFDETKLRLLLAFCDFLAFGRHGQSITGASYVKLPFGPAPQDAAGEIVSLPAENGHAEVLSEQDMAIADEVVDHYHGWSSSALSDEARSEFTGWRMVDQGEAIPYGTVFLAADQTPSPETVELGQRYARELGLVAP